MSEQVKFNPEAFCCECGARGSFDLTSKFLCHPCWQEWSRNEHPALCNSATKSTYRGCEIEAHRDRAMGGWTEVYWSAFTADGYEIASGFGGGTVREMFSAMKENVDNFLDKCHGNKAEWEAF